MKVLLVALNAKYIHSNLAVYSLRSYSNKYSEQIKILELTINHSEEDILMEIYKEKAEIVVFSCYIWNINLINRVSTELIKVQPNAVIWYGGPEVSYDAKECLTKEGSLKGIMLGEGEKTFQELVEYYIEGKSELGEIAGLAFKEKDRIIITKERLPLSLDEIPFPYEHMETFKNRIIYYESSRGCPFSCSYCLSSIDRKVRFRSTDLVERELGLFLEYQVPQVKFVDRTFNCNKKHAMDIWQFIKERDNGITNFHFELSADLLEEDEIELLASLRPGQVQLEIGVQTTNPDTAAAIHRNMDFAILSKKVNQIKSGGNIHQHLDLIAGLPLENYASFEKSFQEVYELKPDQLQLGFLKILKGSSMETDCSRYGIVCRDTAPYEVLYTSNLSYDEVLRLKGVCEMVEVYYNSGQFAHSIQYLEHYYSSPMKLYQDLSDFYEITGNNVGSHSRIRRYEILLEFFKTHMLKVGEDKDILIELFSEILVFDLFLREDLKSRPAFATKNTVISNIRELYDKYQKMRKTIHIEGFQYQVLESSRTGRVVKQPVIILYDYSSRDFLNKSAKISILEK